MILSLMRKLSRSDVLRTLGRMNSSCVSLLLRFRNFTMEDVQTVVETNDKQRFAVEEEAESNRLKIRANQGHTLQVSGGKTWH